MAKKKRSQWHNERKNRQRTWKSMTPKQQQAVWKCYKRVVSIRQSVSDEM
jgi:predicted Fe-S protein YdhL (DUF1289 family)